MTFNDGDFVLATWLDAFATLGWTDESEILLEHDNGLAYTAGVVVSHEGPFLVLAQSWGPERGQYDIGNLWYIPHAMLQAVEVIQAGVRP